MDIHEQIEKINNQKDFVIFLKLLAEDFENNSNEWENNNLKAFINGMEGYTRDTAQEDCSWKGFAEMLLAASVYE